MVSQDLVVKLVCLAMYLDLLAYLYVKVFCQSGIRISLSSFASRYRSLDNKVKQRVKAFLAVLAIQYSALLVGGLGLFLVGLFFVPIIMAIVYLFVYQYSWSSS